MSVVVRLQPHRAHAGCFESIQLSLFQVESEADFFGEAQAVSTIRETPRAGLKVYDDACVVALYRYTIRTATPIYRIATFVRHLRAYFAAADINVQYDPGSPVNPEGNCGQDAFLFAGLVADEPIAPQSACSECSVARLVMWS